MGRNKDLREKIASIRRKIGEHEDKIRREHAKTQPNQNFIVHWEHEIDAHKNVLSSCSAA